MTFVLETVYDGRFRSTQLSRLTSWPIEKVSFQKFSKYRSSVPANFLQDFKFPKTTCQLWGLVTCTSNIKKSDNFHTVNTKMLIIQRGFQSGPIKICGAIFTRFWTSQSPQKNWQEKIFVVSFMKFLCGASSGSEPTEWWDRYTEDPTSGRGSLWQRSPFGSWFSTFVFRDDSGTVPDWVRTSGFKRISSSLDRAPKMRDSVLLNF